MNNSLHAIVPCRLESNRASRVLSKALVLLLRFTLLFLLAALSACTETVNLQAGLNDADANEIISVLRRSGIDAKKVTTKEGVTLTVDEKDISAATEAMHAAGLPRRNLSDLGQMFKKEGMISSPMEERIRYIHGLSEELENTLQQFDNVVAARVHVVLPERIAPGEPIQPSSAAVFIKYRAPFDEDTAIPRIRNLVASSIPGLGGEDGHSKVSVVLTQTELVAASINWETVGPFVVQASSASSLTTTLLGLLALSGFSIVALILVLAFGRERLFALLKGLKLPSKKAGSVKASKDNNPESAVVGKGKAT